MLVTQLSKNFSSLCQLNVPLEGISVFLHTSKPFSKYLYYNSIPLVSSDGSTSVPKPQDMESSGVSSHCKISHSLPVRRQPKAPAALSQNKYDSKLRIFRHNCISQNRQDTDRINLAQYTALREH
jgi:hypothetical protein